MTNQDTINKLVAIKLSAMASAFELQLADSKMGDVPFEDRMAMLVDAEFNTRKSNHLKRLILLANFDQPDACIANIDYHSVRNISKENILRLASCEYIVENKNIFITGATGCGKTYLACTLGMEACKQFYKTVYVRLPDLLIYLEMARDNNTYKKVLSKYANPKLLILYEWLLLKPTEEQQRDIFELISARRKKSPTIFCSQFLKDNWEQKMRILFCEQSTKRSCQKQLLPIDSIMILSNYIIYIPIFYTIIVPGFTVFNFFCRITSVYCVFLSIPSRNNSVSPHYTIVSNNAIF